MMTMTTDITPPSPPRDASLLDCLDCLGVPVARPTRAELFAWFFGAAYARASGTLYIANAHTLNLASRDARYRAVLARGSLVVNDGAGLELYAKLAGSFFYGNFNGTDLFPALFASAGARGERQLRVVLFGGVPGRAARAAENVERTYPGVRVVGVLDGYRREGVVETINAADADVVLVGMGNPLQETWIDEHAPALRAGVICGVGALIDFLSGEIPRAPRLVRQLRCEWIFRLAREPRRLFVRYLVGNPEFVARALLHVTRRRPPLLAR